MKIKPALAQINTRLGVAESNTRAYTNIFTSYFVHCNRVGYKDRLLFWGSSN
jgi:hypothetical protein